MQHLFGIAASVLHLGNVQFECDSKGYATLDNNAELGWVSTVSLQYKVLYIQILSHYKILFSVIFIYLYYFILILSLQLLGVEPQKLQEGLTYRKIEAKIDQVTIVLQKKKCMVQTFRVIHHLKHICCLFEL